MSLNIAKVDKKRVVIVGGGFGGLKLANKLKKSGFQVVLIDKNNYHQFPPLIYQVASAGMEPTSISFPFRKIFQHRKDFYFRENGGSTRHFPGKEHDTDFHWESRIRLPRLGGRHYHQLFR